MNGSLGGCGGADEEVRARKERSAQSGLVADQLGEVAKRWNRTVSQRGFVSWLPPDAPKPLLPRQSPTTGEGGPLEKRSPTAHAQSLALLH